MAERVNEYEVQAQSCGHMTYERRVAGDIERGVMLPYDRISDEQRANASSIVELGFDGGRPYVKQEIRFTARSRPATDAYRAGWETLYGAKTREQAN